MSYPVLFFKKAYPHICETTEISEAVKTNLTARNAGDCTEIINSAITFDPGDFVMAYWQWRAVPGTSIKYLDRDYSYFRYYLQHSTLREELYWKIHGGKRLLCLSKPTFEQLQKYFADHHLELLEAEATCYDQATQTRADLSQHPNIQL